MVSSKSPEIHFVVIVYVLRCDYEWIFSRHIYSVEIKSSSAKIKQSHAVISEWFRLCKYITESAVQMAHYIELVMAEPKCSLKSSDRLYYTRISVRHRHCKPLYNKSTKGICKLFDVEHKHLHHQIRSLITSPLNFYILIF